MPSPLWLLTSLHLHDAVTHSVVKISAKRKVSGPLLNTGPLAPFGDAAPVELSAIPRPRRATSTRPSPNPVVNSPRKRARTSGSSCELGFIVAANIYADVLKCPQHVNHLQACPSLQRRSRRNSP